LKNTHTRGDEQRGFSTVVEQEKPGVTTAVVWVARVTWKKPSQLGDRGQPTNPTQPARRDGQHQRRRQNAKKKHPNPSCFLFATSSCVSKEAPRRRSALPAGQRPAWPACGPPSAEVRGKNAFQCAFCVLSDTREKNSPNLPPASLVNSFHPPKKALVWLCALPPASQCYL
jgi:hypothetical protein